MITSERLQGIAGISPDAGIAGLEADLRRLAGLDFKWVLTRGNWHRLGGVVDAAHRPVDNNIAQWAERESGGNLDELIARHGDKGYLATRLAGQSHYFTAVQGDNPEDFLQLEIEELQEVIDRPLFDPEWPPESLEELIDPPEHPRLDPEPIGRPCYLFRRLTPVAGLVDEAAQENRALANLRRFLDDWHQSSAFEGEPFCRHWVLALREYLDSDGERRLSARPLSTFAGKPPELPPGETLQGAELANAIHGYDRRFGYPFAWYFALVSSKGSNFPLAEAVLRDQMGAYDYLPARDLRVLRRWEEWPYGV
ncbi:MAG: hypothetical protein A2286_04765 [Gammaproteobacteria bacterium RIFOXYA12_FULL_61_12]|nr:MAG: hypothetical protein A2514_12605 [Gammaproteobacteria bacterium RIFOXYD12_FULL_61_37]OGT94009.1 MAG: hypothetical protein A2286_04765 [Gammaproteobacteria bacterium RIFOXYA12_FULL_61_12]